MSVARQQTHLLCVLIAACRPRSPPGCRDIRNPIRAAYRLYTNRPAHPFDGESRLQHEVLLFMLEMIKEFRLFRRIIYHRIWINLGDSLFYVVLMWVLYDLTKDPFYTSMGGFMFSLSDVLNFFCGPVIDRSDRGRLLVVSSGIQFLIAAALYLLSAKGHLSVWMLVCCIPFFNLMSRMTYSIHNVLVPGIVPKENLVTANSILSMTSTGIDLLFNAVTGVLLVLLSLKHMFLINSSINLAAFLVAGMVGRGLSAGRHRPANQTEDKTLPFREFLREYRADLKSGLVFIRNRVILSLVIPLVGLNLLYAMMVVNLPAFSSEVFGASIGYGLILTLFAAGSISGAAVSSRLMKRFPVGKLLPVSFLYGGISWVLMALVVERLPLLGALLIVMASNALGIINIVFGTIFQQLPPRQMIGRVNTVNLSLMAIASLYGSILGGIIVQKFDSVFPFLLCGLGYLAIAIAMRVNRLVCTLPKAEDMSDQILASD